MKLVVNETAKVTIKVIENNKIIEKISVGKRAKVEAVKEISARYNIETVTYEWKIGGIGGAGIWNSMKDVNFETFIKAF